MISCNYSNNNNSGNINNSSNHTFRKTLPLRVGQWDMGQTKVSALVTLFCSQAGFIALNVSKSWFCPDYFLHNFSFDSFQRR